MKAAGIPLPPSRLALACCLQCLSAMKTTRTEILAIVTGTTLTQHDAAIRAYAASMGHQRADRAALTVLAYFIRRFA